MLAVDSSDRGADWELGFAARAHRQSIVLHIAARKKDSDSMVSTERASLWHHHKVERSS